MDRIGLLTIHNTINFGSQLQTLGLYKAVETLGYDVEIIDYTCKAIADRESTLPLRDAKSIKDIIKSLLLHRNLERRKNNFQSFMRDNTRISKNYTSSTIAHANEQYDTFLVGSDIVWGLNITGDDYTYMLDFAQSEKRKIAFSSSVGTKWSEEKAAVIKKLLECFDDIAVREEDAAEWVSNLLGKDVDVTCDPTMLWDKEFWSELADKSRKSTEKYILVYMSDPENKCIRSAIEYGKQHNMPVYYINYRAPVFGTKDKRPTSLQEWLTLFMNAEVVFSASYHGLLFAMYFEKQFYYFNWVNKSRMDSLAKTLGIEDREGTQENMAQNTIVDYNRVNSVLNSKREYSWDRLRSMLK